MISSEVQRTLVKSPPELWAELSDPTSLARHLGELGEIRITRTEPERTVEWEAADTTGKVLLKQSGWGTKVTLTAAREVAAFEPIAEPEREPAIDVEPEPEPVAVEEPDPVAIVAEPEATVAELPPELEPRRGFFARLFGRRKGQESPQPSDQPETALESESPTAIEITELEPIPEDLPPPPEELPEDLPDIAAELKAAEEAATAEVTAVLTAVLDRLGAAHHRPFSRS
jgi:hypothetical protein